jgi:hypothetical protein
MPMTLYEYKILDEPEQYNVLWSKEVFIDHRIRATYNFLLYQIEGFYVELKYNREENKMQGIRSFSSTEQLEPYLRKIKLLEMQVSIQKKV